MDVKFTLHAQPLLSSTGSAAGVDIAEVVDLARPPFAPAHVTNPCPPDDVGLLHHAERAFVGALLVARAVTLAGNVLLVGYTVDPDLPVAAADVAHQIDRLTRRDREPFRADHHVAFRG